jgi:hypothetical protein
VLSLPFTDEFYRFRVHEVFWKTEHVFKPAVSSSLAKRYALAAAFLNVYPYVVLSVGKLCFFFIFTASNFEDFNIIFNVLYTLFCVVLICCLLTKPRLDGRMVSFATHENIKIALGTSFYALPRHASVPAVSFILDVRTLCLCLSLSLSLSLSLFPIST